MMLIVKVIVENVVTFFETQCSLVYRTTVVLSSCLSNNITN